MPVVVRCHNEARHIVTLLDAIRRYEREAIALRRVFPDSHLTFWEMLRLIAHGIGVDVVAALRAGKVWRVLPGIVTFRVMQYWGSFMGMHYRSAVPHQLMMRFYHLGGGR